MDKFLDYMLDTYITPTSDYPATVWVEYSNSITCTTNACESFHSHLNGSTYKAHPNIFNLTETLLEFHCDTYAPRSWISINRNVEEMRLRTKERKLAEYMSRLELNEFTRFEYLKRISFKFLPVRI